MKKSAQKGFTLIELMVVITITAVIGVFTLSNYRSFGEDQNLKSAVLDIQSQFRAAQTNAQTNVKCDTANGAVWQIELNRGSVKLKCQDPIPSPPSVVKKTVTFPTNIVIDSLNGGSSCTVTFPSMMTFGLLSGQVSLGDPNCASLTIVLKNTNTTTTKSLTVDQSGRIYAN